MTPHPLPDDLATVVTRALSEDIGSGDITAQLIPLDARAVARLIFREAAVLCGTPWAAEVIRQLDSDIAIQWHAVDGELVSPNAVVAILAGSARNILTAERCLLNFLQTLSATATLSRNLSNMVAHTKVKLLDTRKTLPGLRSAQKYAVRTGGCFNHRMGLYDGFLIKENHISACGSIANAVISARRLYADRPVEVEVESITQLEMALDAGADIIMLDNFTVPAIRSAVTLNQGRAKLEASGGINENSLVEIAETGVDYISIGALTKNCKAVDLTLLFTQIQVTA